MPSRLSVSLVHVTMNHLCLLLRKMMWTVITFSNSPALIFRAVDAVPERDSVKKLGTGGQMRSYTYTCLSASLPVYEQSKTANPRHVQLQRRPLQCVLTYVLYHAR